MAGWEEKVVHVVRLFELLPYSTLKKLCCSYIVMKMTDDSKNPQSKCSVALSKIRGESKIYIKTYQLTECRCSMKIKDILPEVS